MRIASRKTSRAAIALMLFASMVAVSLPAQAAGRFGPMFGTPDPENPDRLFEQAICDTDYSVRQNFAAAGFSKIYIGGRSSTGKVIDVKANRDGVTYLMQYNRCTQQILGQRALTSQ